MGGLGTTCCPYMTLVWLWLSFVEKIYFHTYIMTYTALLDHSEHEVWIPFMWSTSMVRCPLVFSVCGTNFGKSQTHALLIINLCTITYWRTFNHKSGHTVLSAQICDSFVCHEINWVSGPELLYRWSRYHMQSIYDIGLMMPLFCSKAIFSYICMYNGQYRAQESYDQWWSVTTRIKKYGPHIFDLHPWICSVLHFLCDTKNLKIPDLRFFGHKHKN